MLSARLYGELDSEAVIPIIRNNPKNPPELPAFSVFGSGKTSETPPRRKLHTSGSSVTSMEWLSMPRRQSDRIRSSVCTDIEATWLSETHLEGGTVRACNNFGWRGRYRTADRWCVKPELYH